MRADSPFVAGEKGDGHKDDRPAKACCASIWSDIPGGQSARCPVCGDCIKKEKSQTIHP